MNDRAVSADDLAVCELPGSLRELADLIGIDAVWRLVQRWGGVRLFIPVTMPPEHEIAATIGPEAAEALAGHYGGDVLELAKGDHALRCLRNRAIVDQYDRGVPAARLARDYGLTLRTIRSIINRPPGMDGARREKHPGQLTLDL